MLAGCAGPGALAQREADKAPATILADAADALRHSSSYRVTGMIDPGVHFDVVVVPHGSAGKVTVDGIAFKEVALNRRLWIQGAAFWAAFLPAAQAAEFGDDWVLVQDRGLAKGWAGRLMNLEESIPSVVFGPHPGLVKSRSSFRGRDTLQLRNANDVYDVLADGVPYPVRWLDLRNPGLGGSTVCGIEVSAFNAPASVSPPNARHTLSVLPSPPPS
jgi:hypothetical protein